MQKTFELQENYLDHKLQTNGRGVVGSQPSINIPPKKHCCTTISPHLDGIDARFEHLPLLELDRVYLDQS